MITKLDGLCYLELINGGIKNLEKHRQILNDLNVFPVPDGDTGTNMVMTLRCGYDSVKTRGGAISDIARQFSGGAVLGARGNSGVIVSQFFKGMAEGLKGVESADCAAFANSLKKGCEFAYAAVAKPVEGTMLTVLREASFAVCGALPLASINEAIDVFLAEARASLARTPDLLPILKKANVVDSGGSGIVYLFEGMKKHLNGEKIDAATDATHETPIDLSDFNRNTVFEYGYCVEGLLQITRSADSFSFGDFQKRLSGYGESAVTSLEGDKIKLHIHVKDLGALMSYCQRYGEFLTVKIDNMTVQNSQIKRKRGEPTKFLYDSSRELTNFAVIAVAGNEQLQRRFFEMGADVVILSEIAPSSQDFLEAFELVASKNILVFPNSANSILASMQAGSLYKNAKVTVVNCRSMTECYATLPILDYNGTLDEAVSAANDTLSAICQISLYHAVKDVTYGGKKISKNDFFALEGNKLIDVRETLEEIAISAVKNALKDRECDVITLFYGRYIASEFIENLVEVLEDMDIDAEVVTVNTYETAYDITVTLE